MCDGEEEIKTVCAIDIDIDTSICEGNSYGNCFHGDLIKKKY